MSHTKMIDAFSVVIQNSLSLYEEQTPLYYCLTIYGSWFLTALSILSLASVFFTIGQKKPYHFAVPILFLWLGYEGIHMPRPNLAVFYGYNLAQLSYPANENPDSFLHRTDNSNPVCCTIGEDDYLQAKRLGFKEYANAKAKALVDLVEIEKKSKQSD